MFVKSCSSYGRIQKNELVLLGWNPSTTTKMAKCYGHIGNAAHRAAVATLDPQTKAKRGGTKVSTATAETKKGKAVSA